MGEIVAAVACAHAPGVATRPEPDAAGMKERFYAGMRQARARLAAARPDVLIVVSNEHLQNFFFDNWPALCIAYPEQIQGPIESWMPIPQVSLRGYPDLGRYLVTSALNAHFDVASSQDLVPDHGVILPLHHLRPEMDLPLVVVLQNCVEPPLPTLRRCYEFGRFLGQAIRAWPRPERFALIGVGGISHWIGVKRMGEINEAWDRWFLDLVCRGRTEEVASIPPESVLRDAGNGGEEIRNWLTVMAATGGHPAEQLAYEPVLDWVAGSAVVYWDLATQGAAAV
jgi:hypothetical protein